MIVLVLVIISVVAVVAMSERGHERYLFSLFDDKFVMHVCDFAS